MNLIQHKISLFFLFFILPLRLQGQDFIPYAEFDSTTGNYIISYERDPETGFIHKTLFVPPVKVLPAIGVAVSADDPGYRFTYTISNGVSAVQSILSFDLQGEEGMLLISPSTWSYSSYQNQPFANFFHFGDSGDVVPGGSLSVVVQSGGLPRISNARIYGSEESISFQFDVEPSHLADRLIDSLESIPANRYVGLPTVTPKLPPAPFTAISFLDTLKSYITQSRALGWITSDQARNKYLRFVDTARAYLQANIRGVTKARLDSTILSVYPDSVAGLLTSEACALIRFNSEYVLQKLREEDSTFAAVNTSSSSDATATNNARHLVKSGGYLHEVFASGGEIFYRRSTDEGVTWDQTHWLNRALGENAYPCITATQHGSIIVLWQRRIASSTYEIWFARSDDGTTWSESAQLTDVGSVEVSSYQTDGPTPVVAERYGDENVLVAVYCTSQGLRYRTSADEGATWQVPLSDIISGEYNDRVRYPSVAGGEKYLSLVYDYAGMDASPYSRINGSSGWSGEAAVGKDVGGSDNTFSSVAIDANNNPIAVWSSILNSWTRSVVFRAGYNDNKWGDWFTAFGQGAFGSDWVSPSVTYYRASNGQYSVAIANHTTSNAIKLIRYVDDMMQLPHWEVSTLSTSGAWANLTQESATSGAPVYQWTDPSQFPYEIPMGSMEGLSPVRRTVVSTAELTGSSWKRRAVVYHPALRATLSLEFEPMRIVNASGDTSVVSFKASPRWSRGERDSITLSNMWDYLGSERITLPANARRLMLTKQFITRGPAIGKQRFLFRVLNANGVQLAVLDSAGTSGTVSLNIAPYAGMNVWLRPQLTLQGIDPPNVSVAVGDVYTLPNDSTVKPKGKKEGK